MGLRFLGNEAVFLKDTLLICFVFNCPCVCMCDYLCVCVCVVFVLICFCLSESKATWVRFLDCTSKHFIDTHSSSQCIDFPLADAS